jgi:hypothetical protein
MTDVSKEGKGVPSSVGSSSSTKDDGIRQRHRKSSTAEQIANAVAKKVPAPLQPVVVRFVSLIREI